MNLGEDTLSQSQLLIADKISLHFVVQCWRPFYHDLLRFGYHEHEFIPFYSITLAPASPINICMCKCSSMYVHAQNLNLIDSCVSFLWDPTISVKPFCCFNWSEPMGEMLLEQYTFRCDLWFIAACTCCYITCHVFYWLFTSFVGDLVFRYIYTTYANEDP